MRRPARVERRATAGSDLSRCDRARHFIKQRIMTKETSVGARLNDRETAERRGISRTPVREAFPLWQKEGFVEAVPRLGVRPLSLEDIRERFDLLTARETLAVGLPAARHPTPEEPARLSEAVKEMKAALKGGDFPAWIEADARFHRALFQLSGDRGLAEAGMSDRDQVQRAHGVALELRARSSKSMEGHAELLELIRRGEGEAARECHHAEWGRARSWGGRSRAAL